MAAAICRSRNLCCVRRNGDLDIGYVFLRKRCRPSQPRFNWLLGGRRDRQEPPHLAGNPVNAGYPLGNLSGFSNELFRDQHIRKMADLVPQIQIRGSGPTSILRELKHIKWDDWELPGVRDTWVYLVFDPTDALSAAARSHKPGKFDGLPREVTLVHRLESHWYAVQFSTDESWDRRYVLPAEQPAPPQTTAEEPPPADPIPQDSPCADQPRSLSELTASLDEGRAPSAEEEVGTWVEIGYFDNGIEPHYQSLNCTGIMRGKKFEFAMIGESYAYVMELHTIGSPVFRVRLEPNQKGSSEYSVGDDEDGDAMDVYTCRLTQRETLACLNGGRGEEFKKMKVEDSQLFGEPKP